MAETLNLPRERFTISRLRITEVKQAELDNLLIQIQNAQFEYNQQKAISDSLALKIQLFSQSLAEAEASRTEALNNLDLIRKIKDETENLGKQSSVAYNTIKEAAELSNAMTRQLSEMIRQLVFAVEVVNKFSNAIIRKKALNPLVSNELVDLSATLGKDANTAVSLSLVALKSAYSANLGCLDATSSNALQRSLVEKLNYRIHYGSGNPDVRDSLLDILNTAYINSTEYYQQMLVANQNVKSQFSINQALCDAAAVKLASLQAGYAAASAAALAN